MKLITAILLFLTTLSNPNYTESDSKIGRWQGGVLNFDPHSDAEAVKLKKFSDAGRSKFSGCPTPPEPILESRAVYILIPSKSALTDALATVPAGESLWIVGSMAESFEWQIVEQMSQEFPWQMILEGRQPPTFAEYRKIILDHGFTIAHIEVHREPISSSDWASILPDLGLEGAPNHAYSDEFRKRCQVQQGGIYKQLLIKVTLKSPKEPRDWVQ